MRNTGLWLQSSLTVEEMSICAMRDNEGSGGWRGAGGDSEYPANGILWS